MFKSYLSNLGDIKGIVLKQSKFLRVLMNSLVEPFRNEQFTILLLVNKNELCQVEYVTMNKVFYKQAG